MQKDQHDTMSMEIATPTVPSPETAPPAEPSKYAELLLDLTGENYTYAVRAYKDKKGVFFYCVSDFIQVICKHTLSKQDALSEYVQLQCKLTHDIYFLCPSRIQFKGPLEYPTSCLKIQGLSVLYHDMDKRGMIQKDRQTKFEKVIEDCLNGKEAQHVSLHDDGQLPALYEAYDKGILEGHFLNGKMDLEGSPLEFTHANYYSDETAHLLGPHALQRVFNKKMEMLKAMKGAQEEEVNAAKAELRKISKLMKNQKTEVDTLQAKCDALMKRNEELEGEMQMQERRKKQKGEAFTLRDLVDEMKITVNQTQFNNLSKQISTIMKEKYPDRGSFSKNKIMHYYPDDKRLLELLVTTEMVGVSLADL